MSLSGLAPFGFRIVKIGRLLDSGSPSLAGARLERAVQCERAARCERAGQREQIGSAVTTASVLWGLALLLCGSVTLTRGDIKSPSGIMSPRCKRRFSWVGADGPHETPGRAFRSIVVSPTFLHIDLHVIAVICDSYFLTNYRE